MLFDRLTVMNKHEILHGVIERGLSDFLETCRDVFVACDARHPIILLMVLSLRFAHCYDLMRA